MANIFSKMSRYFSALFNSKFEANADPAIQIQMAISDAQEQHQTLKRNAAALIATEKRIEMELASTGKELEASEAAIKQYIAEAQGTTDNKEQLEATIENLATEVITLQNRRKSLIESHQNAKAASERAKAVVKQNTQELKQLIQNKKHLLSKLDQTRFQEQINTVNAQFDSLNSNDSYASIEAKIDQRYATALGESELNELTSPNIPAVDRTQLEAKAYLNVLKAELSAAEGKKELEQSTESVEDDGKPHPRPE